LVTTFDILKRFNNKALTLVTKLPTRLPGASMVQHVSVGNEGVSLVPVDRDSENTRCHHHAVLTVLLQGELLVLGHFLADELVIGLDVFDLI